MRYPGRSNDLSLMPEWWQRAVQRGADTMRLVIAADCSRSGHHHESDYHERVVMRRRPVARIKEEQT